MRATTTTKVRLQKGTAERTKSKRQEQQQPHKPHKQHKQERQQQQQQQQQQTTTTTTTTTQITATTSNETILRTIRKNTYNIQGISTRTHRENGDNKRMQERMGITPECKREWG
jgi:hypothetical protein